MSRVQVSRSLAAATITATIIVSGCLTPVASGQTIVVDGREMAANETTVAPAAARISSSPGLLLSAEEREQLTDAVLANLTRLALTDIALFAFATARNSSSSSSNLPSSGACKVFPGDAQWPRDSAWDVLHLLTGGALIKTRPLESPCYDGWGNYDEDRCTYIAESWRNTTLHGDDPTSINYSLYQGLTCLPTNINISADCTLGGTPSYAVNVTNVAQIQLAVNFARNNNIRLVVKNTGHDANGRSTGAGALSIWTRHMRSIEFLPAYETPAYSGAALKVSAAVMSYELYQAADRYGVLVVGGEGYTVGFAGVYIAGGGHGPMSPYYGIAADSVLSVDVVLPDGRFAVANETHNTELFYALRGGGGSTFGVATSYTVRAYPALSSVAVATFAFGTDALPDNEAFWAGIRAYWEALPSYNALGHYEYFTIFHDSANSSALTLTMSPWFAPNTTADELQSQLKPLVAAWAALGIDVAPNITEYGSFLAAWEGGFARERSGSVTTKTAARLFPTENFDGATKFNATFAAIRDLIVKGGDLIAFGMNGGGRGDYPENAVNPAWRGSAMFAISAIRWADRSSLEVAAQRSRTLTNEWMVPWRDVTPGGGAYMSEGDITEPDFQQVFYGSDNYERLLRLKQSIDPSYLFYAKNGVGSEDWYISDQLDGLPTNNGRLCKS